MTAFSQQVRDCRDRLATCHTACLSTAMTYCLEQGEEHARPQHLRLMLDCAAFCATAEDFLARKSQLHNRICALCAEICTLCAQDCENLGGMQECAAACRTCAGACRIAARLGHAEILTMASLPPPD